MVDEQCEESWWSMPSWIWLCVTPVCQLHQNIYFCVQNTCVQICYFAQRRCRSEWEACMGTCVLCACSMPFVLRRPKHVANSINEFLFEFLNSTSMCLFHSIFFCQIGSDHARSTRRANTQLSACTFMILDPEKPILQVWLILHQG